MSIANGRISVKSAHAGRRSRADEPVADELRVGGFVPFTMVDYPGRLAAVIFCQGCSWRCRYCHNPHLQSFETPSDWTWPKVFVELQHRRGFLEAVVFSGGEPTLQPSLAAAIREVRAMGFLVGLHTAGASPAALERVLPSLDWVGFDVKAPFDERYRRVTVGAPEVAARASLQALLASGVPYELRTTRHPRLLRPEDFSDLERELAAMGAQPTRLQEFRPDGCVDAELVTDYFHPAALEHSREPL